MIEVGDIVYKDGIPVGKIIESISDNKNNRFMVSKLDNEWSIDLELFCYFNPGKIEIKKER